MKTGVHDLRLYRNGQLVGQWPEAGKLTYKSLNTTSKEELRAWRKATEIQLDKSGKATKTFTVRLPRREDLKEVAFTAYAFNLDRVKSETARQTYMVPAQLKTVKGRAYLITVGVSGNQDMDWQLSFAAEDAKLIQKSLGKRLEAGKRYETVVPVCLVTTPAGSSDPEAQELCRGSVIQPTKENIKTVLDILAGRTVELRPPGTTPPGAAQPTPPGAARGPGAAVVLLARGGQGRGVLPPALRPGGGQYREGTPRTLHLEPGDLAVAGSSGCRAAYDGGGCLPRGGSGGGRGVQAGPHGEPRVRPALLRQGHANPGCDPGFRQCP